MVSSFANVSKITTFLSRMNYSKLINLFGKGQRISEHLFKWLPKSPFSLATPQLHEDLDQTGNHIQTTPRIPSFWQGVICHFGVSQFGGHREQTRSFRLSVKVPHQTVSNQRRRHESNKGKCYVTPL